MVGFVDTLSKLMVVCDDCVTMDWLECCLSDVSVSQPEHELESPHLRLIAPATLATVSFCDRALDL